MRALILGASGAIGSAVARRASQRGDEVHAVGRAGSDWRRLSEAAATGVRHAIEVSDPAAVARLISETAPDWILMAAFPGHASADPRESLPHLMRANANSVLDGLALAGYDRAITWIGSGLFYREIGASASELPEGRSYRLRGEVKTEESRLVATLASQRSLSLTELRVFTGFGPWEQPGRLVPSLLRAALGGARPKLATRGTRRDWLHYEDIADACLASANWSERRPRVLDACSGELHEARDISSLLEAITGKRLVAAGEFPQAVGYGDALPGRVPSRAELDWQPRYDLAKGLAQCWDWARSRPGRRWLIEQMAESA